MTTLAALAVRLLDSDPPPRQSDPHIAHVPPPIDIELAARKLVNAAFRQGLVLTISHRARKGAPGHFQTTVRVTSA